MTDLLGHATGDRAFTTSATLRDCFGCSFGVAIFAFTADVSIVLSTYTFRATHNRPLFADFGYTPKVLHAAWLRQDPRMVQKGFGASRSELRMDRRRQQPLKGPHDLKHCGTSKGFGRTAHRKQH